MKQRLLGNSDMQVSAIGLGCMGITHASGLPMGKQDGIEVIRKAYDMGYTFFDTAECYTAIYPDGSTAYNEEVVGEALRTVRDKVVIATKYGVRHGGDHLLLDSRPATIRSSVEGSLSRLGTDYIDLYYQHRIDPNVAPEEVAETMAELIKEGKILHWGMCEVNADTIRRAHKICPVTAIQSEYHLMHRVVEENGVLNTCEQLGIGFVPYSPLNRGFLGGNINEYTQFDISNDNRQTLPRFQPEAIRQNLRIVEVLNAFGRTRGITAAQVALAWLMNKRAFIVPIPGTTKLSHLEENLRASEIVLSEEDMKAIEEAVSAIPVIGSRYDALQESKIQK